MPFPANQVMNYFHVFISLLMTIFLAAIRVMDSYQAICVITLACQVSSFWLRKSCPTAIKLYVEWQISWTSCRILNIQNIESRICFDYIVTGNCNTNELKAEPQAEI